MAPPRKRILRSNSPLIEEEPSNDNRAKKSKKNELDIERDVDCCDSFALENKKSPKRGLPYKSVNATIVLDSSSEIIDNSIDETASEFDWIKTPRSLRNRNKTQTKNTVTKANETPAPTFKKRDSLNVKRISELTREGSAGLWTPAACVKAVKDGESPILDFFGPSRISSASRKRPSTPLEPKQMIKEPLDKPVETFPQKRKRNAVEPSVKPADNLLHGSKLRNVERWLAVASKQASTTPPMSLSPPKRQSAETSSELHPEVKNVLLAVYGDEWESKAFKKCKTDVKDTRHKPKITFKTEGKATRKLKFDTDLPSTKETGNDKKTSRPRGVRRKIFADNGSPASRTRSTCDQPLVTDQLKTPSGVTPKKTRKRMVSIDSVEENVKPVTPANKKTLGTPSSAMSKWSESAKKTPRRTFLASLSVSTPTTISHPEAKMYKVGFAKKKDELCAKLFKLYNSEVFENKLAPDMAITWNPKMRGTAGFCYSKRRRNREGVVSRVSRLELAPRVVDRADRLRDTLVHELCHAAAWIVDGVLDGHGPTWQAWADRAMKRFPELPEIKRCHNYQIATKYTYRCTLCGYSINRQSKSIDIERKRCGHCFGVLELLFNKKKAGTSEAPEFETTRTLRPPNVFALFVKENYKSLKESHPDKKHPEIMKLISERYAVFKSVVTPKNKK